MILVVYNLRLGHFPPLGHISGLKALGHFELKNETRKTDIIYKELELYQVFMCQVVLIFSQNIHYSQKELKYFGLQIFGYFEL